MPAVHVRRVADAEGPLVQGGFVPRQIEGRLRLLQALTDVPSVDSSNTAQFETVWRLVK